MSVHLTLHSKNDQVVYLVSNFARGLGCAIDAVPTEAGQAVRIELPDAGDSLVELLTHVALSATKAGIDLTEPLCQVTHRHDGASAGVTLAICLTDFRIDAPQRLP